MPELPRGISIRTVGDLLDQGYTMNGVCLACKTHRRVDLELVAARIGRHRSYAGLPLHCRRCGSRNVMTQISPRGRGHNGPR